MYNSRTTISRQARKASDERFRFLHRHLGKIIRQLREERNLTQDALASAAGLQRTFISLIELGQSQPTVTTLFKLSFALKCTPSTILALAEDALRKRGTDPVQS